MTKIRVLMAIGLLLAGFSVCKANEVAHGTWGEKSKIVAVRSYWSFTNFKLETTQSCGNSSDGWWRLNNLAANADMEPALQYKKSLLLAAATASKIVQLRCENGAISDLQVEF